MVFTKHCLIAKVLYSFAVALAMLSFCWLNATLIMIDPAGHGRQPGRKLFDSLERAETYQCAEALKVALEQKYRDVRVILTRSPGDEIVPLQNASFANRLAADFFLRLQFYKESTDKPQLYSYQLVFDPIIDLAKRTYDPRTFIPVYQAHYYNAPITRLLGQKMHTFFTQLVNKPFQEHETYQLPVKPLVGITAPALLMEIGLQTDDGWKALIDPLVQATGQALELKE